MDAAACNGGPRRHARSASEITEIQTRDRVNAEKLTRQCLPPAERLQPEEAFSEEEQRQGIRSVFVAIYGLLNPNSPIPAAARVDTPDFDWSQLQEWLNDPEAWEALMLGPEGGWPAQRFVSGWRRRHATAWLAMVEIVTDLGRGDPGLTASGILVHMELLDGFDVPWRPEEHGFAEGKKGMRKRGEMTRNILWRAGNRSAAVADALKCNEPQPMKTKESVAIRDDYPLFAAASVATLEAQGAALEYTKELQEELGDPVLTELNVAEANGKLRLITPAVYVNRFSKRHPFTMGGLQHGVSMFERPTDVASIRDVKAGFLHSLLKRSCWRFACFRDPRDRKRILFFPHSHFGFDWAHSPSGDRRRSRSTASGGSAGAGCSGWTILCGVTPAWRPAS